MAAGLNGTLSLFQCQVDQSMAVIGRRDPVRGYRRQNHQIVPSVAKILTAMLTDPRNTGYDDLAKV